MAHVSGTVPQAAAAPGLCRAQVYATNEEGEIDQTMRLKGCDVCVYANVLQRLTACSKTDT